MVLKWRQHSWWVCVCVGVRHPALAPDRLLSHWVHGWRHTAADRRTWHRSLFREVTGMRDLEECQPDAHSTNQACAVWACVSRLVRRCWIAVCYRHHSLLQQMYVWRCTSRQLTLRPHSDPASSSSETVWPLMINPRDDGSLLTLWFLLPVF